MTSVTVRRPSLRRAAPALALCALGFAAAAAPGCSGSRVQAEDSRAGGAAPTRVAVAKVGRKVIDRQLTMASELVPFEEIDVYAKESGYVKELKVDYGSHVHKGDVLAVLEIPELEAQLQQDEAAEKNAADRVATAKHELARIEAQHRVTHLQYDRLSSVAKTKPGLVAQQELDDAQGKDLANESAVEGAKSGLDGAESALAAAQATHRRDRALFDYSRITAPFDGIVTRRYANLGTLLQAGTNSSTQAMPLVRLAEDRIFRLVIPVPESYVRYIHVGDPVNVRVGALDKTVTGKVSRFSFDVKEDTRTMHTEVDVPNADGVLVGGMYAEATLMLDRRPDVLAVPLQAVNHEGEKTTVFVVTASNTVEDRPITLGVQTDADGEVVTGLKDGDLVVVGDRGGLKAGQAVAPHVVQTLQYASTETK
ncbi:MAG TPA: efflux RND transporter periplasmic adaptor subunit [Vicinamibacterales bacterium]|nr:efflux RND transporter periplasmic adaptor subunit [Vicinamibacterales bacterium]